MSYNFTNDKKKAGAPQDVIEKGLEWFKEKYIDSDPSGHNVWWKNNPDSGTVTFSNLPNVLPCICGDHPFPVDVAMTKMNNGLEQQHLHCGLPRSGSTVVWQIMNEFFPNQIVRSHEFYDVCPLLYEWKKIVCCVRHPYDVYGSLIRTATKSSDDQVEKEFDRYMDEMKKWLILEKLRRVFPSMVMKIPEILYVKYEDFYGQDRERVNYVLDYLGIDASDEKRDEIAKKFSIDKNAERASLLSGFGEMDKDSQIHGSHISEKRGKIFASSIDEENKQKIQETYSWFFDIFNYTHY